MKCPICATPVGAPNWKARKTYLWSNGYGHKERLFCSVCGAWSDHETLYENGNEAIVTIIQKPTVGEYAKDEQWFEQWSKDQVSGRKRQ